MANVYLHRKSGTLYLALLHNVLHTETKELLTIYMNQSGAIFARPTAMFMDGRFALTNENPDLFMVKS